MVASCVRRIANEPNGRGLSVAGSATFRRRLAHFLDPPSPSPPLRSDLINLFRRRLRCDVYEIPRRQRPTAGERSFDRRSLEGGYLSLRLFLLNKLSALIRTFS